MSTRIDEIFVKLKKLFKQTEAAYSSIKSSGARSGGKDLVSTSTGVLSTSLARSSQGQVLGALIRLLTTVLTHVRVTDDIGDEIVDMLAPYAEKREEVMKAVIEFNADALWLWEARNLKSEAIPARMIETVA